MPDWPTLDLAFDHALDLDGPERAAFLAGLGAEMREALAPLLAAAAADDPVLDHAAAVLAPFAHALAEPTAVHEGARVGPYRVEELVGEGGMGRVYRARRADGAYDRVVALKVVRASLTLAGSDVADRLRRERDLLAALDHAGIARLVDGGETEDGVPYLVTEFVDGVPITDYAEAHGLSIAERVRLMVGVCRAVDHAHRRLVVHRDLKPSNVLVTEADGAPHAVVLDFGIARLLDAAEPASGFPLTRTGMRLLTPAYAAPELFDAAATVTTAADVYGLGALLYELLTGQRPHRDAEAGAATAEPVRPSRALTHPTAGAADTQRARHLRGDLDTIALRALAPEPARRYASAAALADDLERHLSGRPVDARPDSVGYVASRFVRRHRGAVAGGALALAMLVAGLGVALVLLAQARAARAEAEAEATRATMASDFASDLFNADDPYQSGRRDVTVLELLASGRQRAGELAYQPENRASLLGLLAASYARMGEAGIADSLYRQALAVSPDRDSPASAHLRTSYATTLMGQGELERAIALYRGVIAQRGVVPVVRRRAQLGLGVALNQTGETAAALGVLDDAYQAAHAAHDSLQINLVASTRAVILLDANRPDDATADFREAFVLTSKLYGPRSRLASGMLSNLGHGQLAQGRVDDAATTFGRAYRMDRLLYPPGHVALAAGLDNLGRAEAQRDHPAAAVAYYEAALATMRRTLSDDSVDLRDTSRRLADVYARVGRCADAQPLAREAVAFFDRQPGRTRLLATRARATVGQCLIQGGHRAEGIELVQAALDSLQRDPSATERDRMHIRSFLPRGVTPRA